MVHFLKYERIFAVVFVCDTLGTISLACHAPHALTQNCTFSGFVWNFPQKMEVVPATSVRVLDALERNNQPLHVVIPSPSIRRGMIIRKDSFKFLALLKSLVKRAVSSTGA